MKWLRLIPMVAVVVAMVRRALPFVGVPKRDSSRVGPPSRLSGPFVMLMAIVLATMAIGEDEGNPANAPTTRVFRLAAAGTAANDVGLHVAGTATRPSTKPAVVVLPLAIDFEDKSDTDEDYGEKVAFAIASKWRTIDGWEVIDRYSVADAMAAGKVARGPDADRQKLATIVRQALAADVAVFGSASGAGATKTLRVCVVDYRDAAGVWPGKPVLDKTYKLDYWTDLRFVLEDAVSAVTGHGFTHPSEDLAILDPASVAAWKKNPNLVANPAFADGADGRLAKWEGVIESHRYAPPWTDAPEAPIQEDRTKMILWSPAPSAGGAAPGAAKAVQFAMPSSVAGMHGLACYSDWIEVRPGSRYRCAIAYASKGPTFLPFVKGYALIDTPGEDKPQRREVYRRQFPKLKSTGGAWETAVADFVPSVLPPKDGHRAPYDLKWVRVDLYCYWPEGRVWVKDVTVKLVEEAPEGGEARNPVTPVSGRVEQAP